MTIFTVHRPYPIPYKWADRVRNGKLVDWRTPQAVAKRQNFALAHCRKMIFQRTVNAASPPQAATGTVVPWRWLFRTGEATEAGGDSDDAINLRCTALMLPGGTSGTDPRFTVTAGAASTTGYFGLLDGSPTFDQLAEVEIFVGPLAADTEYECSLSVIDYARVVQLTVWEEVTSSVDTAATYVTDQSQFATGNEVTDAQHLELVADMHTIWSHAGPSLITLVPDVVGDVWTRTTGTYVNILDNSTTSVTGQSPGFNLATLYRNAFHTNDIEIVFGAYLESASEGGGGGVKLLDSNGEIATVTAPETAAWVTDTGVLDGSGNQKVDIHILGDADLGTTVHAVGLFTHRTVSL